MKRFTARDYLLLAFMLVAAGVCIRLGIWQLDRLHQRQARNAVIEARLGEPAVDFPPSAPLDEQEYHRVTVRGRFVPEQAVFLENQPYNDQAGFHLLVPYQVEGLQQALLVDRGWIAFDQGLGLDPRQLAGDAAASSTIQGVLLPGQAEPALAFLADQVPAAGEPPLVSWRVVNLDGLQAQMPFQLYPLYLAQTAPLPDAEGEPLPVYEPDLSNGPHLSYAIQWFSFAAIALVGGTALLGRRHRRRAFGGQEPVA